MDTPDLKRYEKYVSDWHFYLKGLTERITAPGGEELVKPLSMHVLKTFYQQPYDPEQDFYEQFYDRLR